MSIVTVANEIGLHVNTVSKYFKAVKETGHHMPEANAEQVSLIAGLVDESQRQDISVYEVIKNKWGNASPAMPVKSAALTATAAAIEETQRQHTAQIEALTEKIDTDTEETNELLFDFDGRLKKAEEAATLALSIARSAIDLTQRRNTTSDDILISLMNLIKQLEEKNNESEK